MVSSATWILSAKALFASIGAASVAFFLKVSVPLVVEFTVSQLPLLWTSVLSWLTPPYLYVVINGIIISIAASSRLHRISPEESPPVEAAGFGVPDESPPEIEGAVESEDVLILDANRSLEEGKASDSVIGGNKVRDADDEEQQEGEEEDEEDEFVISRSAWTPRKRSDSPVKEYLPQTLSEKPLASSRFHHRRPAKSSPEGGNVLKVMRPKHQQTLENTWKEITEGRPMPLTRHLRKSDTWENGQTQLQLSSPKQQQQKMRKSETFRDRTNEQQEQSPSPRAVRRAASPSQDELNRRVEAFINKFNEEMRMQRQESLNHYKQMISR